MLSAALRRASGRLARPVLRNASTKIVPVEAEVSMAYDAVLLGFYVWFIAYNARRVVGRSYTPMDYEDIKVINNYFGQFQLPYPFTSG
ncbi:Oidioi.mRNA.OKI2018_I69.XSR.g14312.t1.cds [Oikopleura dioica]|uniref:Oidioi.mRNA.OKI2018_I69.XSR.g14312.t1.cds n=1 Tax=Oikopleura dioica TaxID=34765 RepID=A0ABN7S9F4_OIKDI|nr:Oidioi.mRNA.OKI2018_I69.XSR.g14312.t1.cds [Oikopleura dioica]